MEKEFLHLILNKKCFFDLLQNRDIKVKLNADCLIQYDKRPGKECAGIEITSAKIFDDLFSHGVIPNKTYNSFHLPKVPEDFIIPFLRGLFDGDGMLSYKENYNESSVGFISKSISVVEEFQALIDNLIGKNESNKIKLEINKVGSSYRCSWRGRRQVLKILSLLYDDASIYLQRKYNKYQRLLETIADKDMV